MPAVLVMAKAPVAGRVKTRLEPLFTPEECATLQRTLIERTVRWALDVAPAAACLAYDPPDARAAMAGIVPRGVTLIEQRGAHLGERIASAAAQAHAREDGPLLVVGVDTRLTRAHADAALDALRRGADVVLGPALDGGYYLAALARPAPELFAIDPASWGGGEVLAQTLAAASAAGLSTATIATERDLDTPEDAEALAGDPEIGGLIAAAIGRARAAR